MSRFYNKIKSGLKEVLEYKKGKITLKSEEIDIPEPPLEYTAKDVKRIRSLGPYSQGYFARILNVSTKTVQSWELGTRSPSHAALRLLEVVDKGYYRPRASK